MKRLTEKQAYMLLCKLVKRDDISGSNGIYYFEDEFTLRINTQFKKGKIVDIKGFAIDMKVEVNDENGTTYNYGIYDVRDSSSKISKYIKTFLKGFSLSADNRTAIERQIAEEKRQTEIVNMALTYIGD
ncbi:MAG: hypothetical protein ACRC5M_00285 [Anaeroplasmataceae bacterium]